MVRIELLLLCLAVAPAFALGEATSSGSGTPDSPYRLSLKDDAYRLIGAYRPVPPKAPVAPALSRLPYAGEIEAAAKGANLDPALVHALISVESRHRQEAVSPKGAVGLMQLMPGTAQRYGVRAPGKSREENLRAGTRYLRDLLDMFENRLDLALAAYNAGEGAVQKHGNRIPPFRETRNYVPSVMERYEEWRSPEPERPRSVVYLPGTRLDGKTLQDFLARRE